VPTSAPLPATSTGAPALPRHAVTPQSLRAALGMFGTGVTIITTRSGDGTLRGLTANSFNSVSLSPALILWSLARTSSSYEAFAQATHYTINVLAADQLQLAQRFATRGIDRWAGVAHEAGAGGAPVLPGSAAVFECAHRAVHEAGDHVIFIGEVLACSHTPDTPPLLFHGGQFYTELPLAPAVTDPLA